MAYDFFNTPRYIKVQVSSNEVLIIPMRRLLRSEDEKRERDFQALSEEQQREKQSEYYTNQVISLAVGNPRIVPVDKVTSNLEKDYHEAEEIEGVESVKEFFTKEGMGTIASLTYIFYVDDIMPRRHFPSVESSDSADSLLP